MKTVRSTFLLLVALTLAIVAHSAFSQSDSLKITYVKPGISFKEYNQFILNPLDLHDTRLLPPPWKEDADPRDWKLSEQNQTFLRTAYAAAVRQGIESSGQYNVVKNPTPGTLRLELRILSLQPWAARGEQVTTKGYGVLSFEAHVRDARTGELLAVYEGVQQVGEDYQENTNFNKASNLAQHFNRWGHDISNMLTAAHQRE